MPVRFGDFVFDSERRELRAGANPVRLTPKEFRLLQILIDARPRAISKQELQEQIWPETFVGDASLKTLVSSLRTALREDAEKPMWVKTVYGFGYTFNSEGVFELPNLSGGETGDRIFRLLIGSRTVILSEGATIVGREGDSTVVIDSHTVSRHHATIMVGPEGASIEDLGSKNGTVVGSGRIPAHEPVRLKHGDEIRLGDVLIVFSDVPRAASTITQTKF